MACTISDAYDTIKVESHASMAFQVQHDPFYLMESDGVGVGGQLQRQRVDNLVARGWVCIVDFMVRLVVSHVVTDFVQAAASSVAMVINVSCICIKTGVISMATL